MIFCSSGFDERLKEIKFLLQDDFKIHHELWKQQLPTPEQVEILQQTDNQGNNIFLLTAANYNFETIHYRELIKTYLHCLKGCQIKSKKTAVQCAYNCGLMLQYVSEPLRGDIDVVLNALADNRNALRWAHEQLRTNSELNTISRITSRTERETAIEDYRKSPDYEQQAISGLILRLEEVKTEMENSGNNLGFFFLKRKKRSKQSGKSLIN